MSEGSSNTSYGSSRKCLCGIVADHFTAWTPMNAGRRFFKCSKRDAQSCGYWEWEDREFPSRAVVVINNLKRKNDALNREVASLKKKVEELEEFAIVDAIRIGTMKKQIFHQWFFILVCCGLFGGFISVFLKWG